MTDIRRVGRREIYTGRIFDLTVDRFRDEATPDREFDIEVVHHNGGAAVVPVFDDGSICLIRQWRYALGGVSIEIPAGRIEPGDDPRSTALRELEEEAGLCAAAIEPLGSMLPAPGYCTERLYLFVARDLSQVPQRLDEDERVDVLRMQFADALDAVVRGEIDDAKTVIAILRLAAARP